MRIMSVLSTFKYWLQIANVIMLSKKPITFEKTKLQTVTVISLWVHVASDWLLYNGKCQNQIKVYMIIGFVQ